jgi:hypothetical protein
MTVNGNSDSNGYKTKKRASKMMHGQVPYTIGEGEPIAAATPLE